MRKIEYNYEKGFNRSSKIMEFKLGIESARLLSTLIYKYNDWLERKKITVLKEGYAFYITIPNLQRETNMKPYTIKKAIKQLKTSGLIKVKKIGLPAKNHYILNRSAIQKFDTKHKRAYKNWLDELYSKADEDSTRFMDNHTKPSKESMKTFTKYISEHRIKPQLAEKSPTGELVSAQQEGELSTVTKNKISNNKKILDKKLTSGEKKIAAAESSVKEAEVSHTDNLNSKNDSGNDFIYTSESGVDIIEDMLNLVEDTRKGKSTPADFFDRFVNSYLEIEFKGFRMSEDDELLIYNNINNNAMFYLEDSDIEEYKEEIARLKKSNKECSNDEIIEMVYFEDDKYYLQYEMLFRKIFSNYKRIKQGKREARFGNLFVGVSEMSENYAKDMVEC